MKAEELRDFFLTLYQDKLICNKDKQRLIFNCGRFNLICDITLELKKKEDPKCNP